MGGKQSRLSKETQNGSEKLEVSVNNQFSPTVASEVTENTVADAVRGKSLQIRGVRKVIRKNLWARAEQDEADCKLREQQENHRLERETPDLVKVCELLFRDGETDAYYLKEIKAKAEKGEVSDYQVRPKQQLASENHGEAPKEVTPIGKWV
uniref:Uncharacterized protein n=1 Tax=Knipowitschia caucasica TaxID=637954 RepID=A0AAV2M8Z7_KNICA